VKKESESVNLKLGMRIKIKIESVYYEGIITYLDHVFSAAFGDIKTDDGHIHQFGNGNIVEILQAEGR